MMKRVSLCCLLIVFGVASSLRADEVVRTVQSRLKEGGFYWGEVNGIYNSDTAAAITRYQIRNGLQITGKLDPQVGSEAEFFADQVDYFGEPRVAREKIRRDLQRYNDRWPERRFWLAGELEVKPIRDRLRVTFPLRYELRSPSRRSSGTVWKTLILEKTGDDDFQIVAVNERKAR